MRSLLSPPFAATVLAAITAVATLAQPPQPPAPPQPGPWSEQPPIAQAPYPQGPYPYPQAPRPPAPMNPGTNQAPPADEEGKSPDRGVARISFMNGNVSV